jgi:hypothetical protein
VTSAQQLPENATTTAKAARTEYVVLKRGLKPDLEVTKLEQPETWVVAGHATEANSDAAIKKVAGDEAGTYIAVPARSWQPKTLAVETKKTVTLS